MGKNIFTAVQQHVLDGAVKEGYVTSQDLSKIFGVSKLFR